MSKGRDWRPKPGDRFIRRLPRRYRLRRVLGVPALFSAGYGNVGSSIYYALGIVALVALGATPIVLGIAGILFIFTALTYAEGTAMFPESGGSASFARHGFGSMVGFISGWALLLSYVATIAISAYTIPPYLGYFWEPFKSSAIVGTITSIGIILFLLVLNIRGVEESSRINILFAFVDIVTQISIIILGFLFIFNLDILTQNMFGEGNWPKFPDLIFGIALASLAYTGIETVSQMADETRRPQVRAPKALMYMIFFVLLIFSGISMVALSAMSPQILGDSIHGWARDPVAGIAASFPSEGLTAIYMPLVAILAGSILLIATNAGIMGISRLTFSLGEHRQIPSVFSRIHPRFGTPYIPIVLFCVIALVLLLPGFFASNLFAHLGSLYTFGSLLSFGFAHASILILRIRKPGLDRPFKIKFNVNIRGKDLPLTSIIGLGVTLSIWVVIMVVEPVSRWVGLGWMLLGILGYIIYQRRKGLFSEEGG